MKLLNRNRFLKIMNGHFGPFCVGDYRIWENILNFRTNSKMQFQFSIWNRFWMWNFGQFEKITRYSEEKRREKKNEPKWNTSSCTNFHFPTQLKQLNLKVFRQMKPNMCSAANRSSSICKMLKQFIYASRML